MGGLTKQQRLVRAILAIQNDSSLHDEEKARKRQELLSGKWMDCGSSFDSSKVVAHGWKKLGGGMCYVYWMCCCVCLFFYVVCVGRVLIRRVGVVVVLNYALVCVCVCV